MAARLVRGVGEHELERDIGPTESARGVDTRGEPEADRARVDRGRIDAGAAHECLEPRPSGRSEGAEARRSERAILVDERDDVGDRRERDQVEVPANCRMLRSEECLAELVDDTGAAELGKRIAAMAASRRSGNPAACRPGGDGR